LTNHEYICGCHSCDNNERRQRCIHILDSNNCHCQCTACPICCYYNYGDVFTFFRNLRQQHYDQLNQHVFIPLSNLRPQFDQPDGQPLARLLVIIPTNSDFYAEARRHMNQNLRDEIDRVLTRINNYNNQVETLNQTLTGIINGIINQPALGTLNPIHIPSIFQMTALAIRDVLLRPENTIQEAFANYDMGSQVGGGFRFNGQEQIAIRILSNIQDNLEIRESLEQLRNTIRDIVGDMNNISTQALETDTEIQQQRYRRRRRCCPSIIREIFHLF
jgi:hypothetical protein